MAWVCGWGGLIMQKKGFTQPSPKDEAGKRVFGRSGPRRSPSLVRDRVDVSLQLAAKDTPKYAMRHTSAVERRNASYHFPAPLLKCDALSKYQYHPLHSLRPPPLREPAPLAPPPPKRLGISRDQARDQDLWLPPCDRHPATPHPTMDVRS